MKSMLSLDRLRTNVAARGQELFSAAILVANIPTRFWLDLLFDAPDLPDIESYYSTTSLIHAPKSP